MVVAMPTLETTVNGLKLPNPFVIGSGPPGTNANVIGKALEEGWGAVICKTVSLDAGKVINVQPRYARLRSRDSGEIFRAFRDRFGAHVANGQGEMKGKIFRIAHIGYYDYLDTIGVIAALEHVLAGIGVAVELGAGVRAAQQVFALATPQAQTAHR